MPKDINELDRDNPRDEYMGEVHWLLNNSEKAYTHEEIYEEIGSPSDIDLIDIYGIIGRLEGMQQNPEYGLIKEDEEDETYFFNERNTSLDS